jgi:TonB family protein
MRVVLCIGWVLSLAGSATSRIRHEAASALRCPEGEVELQQLEDGDWLAKGCGRGAFCTLPAEADAKVQCREGAAWIDKGKIRQVVGASEPATSASAAAGADVQYSGSGLDEKEIRQLIKNHILEIQTCYDRALNTAPRLAGKMTLSFTISPTGAVSSSRVVQSYGPNLALEECVAARMRSWTFPKPNGEGAVTVTHPFIFKLGDDGSPEVGTSVLPTLARPPLDPMRRCSGPRRRQSK